MPHIRYFAALAVIAATPASATDFTFDVPVRVENLPSLSSVGIQCAVSTGPGGSAIGVARSVPVPVTGGRYEGTITVEVEIGGFTPPESARTYRCGLTGIGTSATGTAFVLSIDNFIDLYQRATGQTIVSADSRVSGAIP